MQRARADDLEGQRALAELCECYWAPVYAFFRRDGMTAHDARDLTQGLFAELLERGDVAGGDPGKGRFRSYLLACARHYQSNQRDRDRAQKRGGSALHLPFATPADDVHELVAAEPGDQATPEQAYTQAWVRQSVAMALRDLEREERDKGRQRAFALLRGTLEGEPLGRSYADIGAELGVSESAVKVAVHRLRRRFRVTLLGLLGATVEDPSEADAELRELFEALGGT